MQKYRKFLVLLALSATALAVTGCGTAKNTAEKTADISAASAQADQEPSDMIFFNNTMLKERDCLSVIIRNNSPFLYQIYKKGCRWQVFCILDYILQCTLSEDFLVLCY